MSNRCRLLILTAMILGVFLHAHAAHAETQLMILLDASSSMTAPGTPGTSHSKFEEVGSALTALMHQLPIDVSVGLRVMGGTPSADCYTTYLYFAPTQGIRSQFQDQVDAIRPAGSRALYQGISDSLADLGGARRGVDTILLVITDGGDGCNRDFEPLGQIYSYASVKPRIVIYGLDLGLNVTEELGQFVARAGGSITNLDSISDLQSSLTSFAQQFTSNLRIHLIDSEGIAVRGDIVVRNSANTVLAEVLDVSDYSMNVGDGVYTVTGRYLGQEVRSDSFPMTVSDTKTVTLTFRIYLEPYRIRLVDSFGQALRARVSFINSMNEPVLSTDVDSLHDVRLPPDSYTLEIRLGDYIYNQNMVIGPGYESNVEIELPVELGMLEVEVVTPYGTPLNAKVTITDADGTVMDEAPSTSYLYSHLPPGTYRVTAEYGDSTVEDTAYLSSGDQMQLGLEINVALGDLFIMLRTSSGNDAWGWVRVYDSAGNLLERFDTERAESPDWYVTDIPVGTYRIEAEVDGVVRTMSGVEVREYEETEITINFPDETY